MASFFEGITGELRFSANNSSHHGPDCFALVMSGWLGETRCCCWSVHGFGVRDGVVHDIRVQDATVGCTVNVCAYVPSLLFSLLLLSLCCLPILSCRCPVVLSLSCCRRCCVATTAVVILLAVVVAVVTAMCFCVFVFLPPENTHHPVAQLAHI